MRTFRGSHVSDRVAVDFVTLCSDMINLVAYPDHRMLSELGLTAGQAFDLRVFANFKLDEAEQGVDI